MKKGDKMNWSDEKEFLTRDFGYSEKSTGTAVLKSGTKLFHASYWQINKFAPVMTCFTPESYAYENGLGIHGYTYLVILKKDVEVTYYGDDEVRLFITPENVDIYYLGTFLKGRKILHEPIDFYKNRFNEIRNDRYSFSKEYLLIEEILNKIEQEKRDWRFNQNGRFYKF